jgi:hypothetical protein
MLILAIGGAVSFIPRGVDVSSMRDCLVLFAGWDLIRFKRKATTITGDALAVVIAARHKLQYEIPSLDEAEIHAPIHATPLRRPLAPMPN